MPVRYRVVLFLISVYVMSIPGAFAQWTYDYANSANIYHTPGAVGVGTTPASQQLSVGGNLEVLDAPAGGPELSRNGSDWTNPSNGLANQWATLYWGGGSIGFTSSIVSGNGFTGNAQRIVYSSITPPAWGKLYQLITFQLFHQYKITFSYRSSTSLQVILGDNESGAFLPPNTGNALPVTLFASAVLYQRESLDFYAPGGGSAPTPGTWFEIDNVSVKEATAGNAIVRGLVTGGGSNGLKVDLNGQVGIGTTAPTRTIDVAGAAVNGNYTPILRVGTNDVAYSGSGGAIELSAFNNSGTPAPVAVIAPYLTSGGQNTQSGDLRILTSNQGTLGERMRIMADGRVGIGTSPASGVALDVVGTIHATQVIGASYQDVAEWVPATTRMATGTVVVLNPRKTNEVMPSTHSYDTGVAGVVSAAPGILLGEASEAKAKIATTGRVRVKVDATRHPIRVGDLLVTSDTQGAAMVSEPIRIRGRKFHQPGTLIGKALEPLTSGKGQILVLLSLQ